MSSKGLDGESQERSNMVLSGRNEREKQREMEREILASVLCMKHLGERRSKGAFRIFLG